MPLFSALEHIRKKRRLAGTTSVAASRVAEATAQANIVRDPTEASGANLPEPLRGVGDSPGDSGEAPGPSPDAEGLADTNVQLAMQIQNIALKTIPMLMPPVVKAVMKKAIDASQDAGLPSGFGGGGIMGSESDIEGAFADVAAGMPGGDVGVGTGGTSPGGSLGPAGTPGAAGMDSGPGAGGEGAGGDGGGGGVGAGGGAGPGGGDACCFIAGTMITTKDGDVAIEDIKEGDTVVSYDLDGTGEYIQSVVNETVIRTRSGYYVITFKSGRTLGITNDHPLYTTHGWASLDPIATGDNPAYKRLGKLIQLSTFTHVLHISGEYDRIREIKFVPGFLATYTLGKVFPAKNFFADNYLASNYAC